MRRIGILFSLIIISLHAFAQDTGTLTDPRDGNIYNTVKIGNQWWMAKNLAYITNVRPPTDTSGSVAYKYVYDYLGYNESDAKATANYCTYEVLYNSISASNACPMGRKRDLQKEGRNS